MDEEDAVEVGVEDAALGLVLVAAADVPELDEVRAGRAGARVGHVHEADARVDARRALHALVLGQALKIIQNILLPLLTLRCSFAFHPL